MDVRRLRRGRPDGRDVLGVRREPAHGGGGVSAHPAGRRLERLASGADLVDDSRCDAADVARADIETARANIAHYTRVLGRTAGRGGMVRTWERRLAAAERRLARALS